MRPYKVAILWRGDRAARAAVTPQNNRYRRIFEELDALGIHTEPAIYADDMVNEVREQLLGMDGVLVWVNPIDEGRTREKLDPLLREVASKGRWVSAHPDVILKMGVKEVLHRTKHLGWGSDTHLYRTAAEFCDSFPLRLQSSGPRVLKQNRSNGGQGVWRVERAVRSSSLINAVSVLEACSATPEELSLPTFMARCEGYFASNECVIDQPFQPRLLDGMIRCYMGADRVVGFGHQFIRALMPPPPKGPSSSGPRIMHGADAAPFQTLRMKMEIEWTPQMMQTLAIGASDFPIIWDADFLYGPRTALGEDTYVLCEINVSCVFAVPDQAPAAIARLTLSRLKEQSTS